MAAPMKLTPVSEEDHLDEDPRIPGQSFVVMSFLSPDDVLEKKDLFLVRKFLEHAREDMQELVRGLKVRFPSEKDAIAQIEATHSTFFDEDPKSIHDDFTVFKESRGAELDEEFSRESGFETSVRGVKVRGVYDTIEAAKKRIKKLTEVDKYFPMYVGQVGAWVPWDPHDGQVENSEYREDQLNTLMAGYREAMDRCTQKAESHKRTNLEMKEELRKLAAEGGAVPDIPSSGWALIGDDAEAVAAFESAGEVFFELCGDAMPTERHVESVREKLSRMGIARDVPFPVLLKDGAVADLPEGGLAEALRPPAEAGGSSSQN